MYLWNVVYLYFGELFPTVVNSIGVGIAAAIGKVGNLYETRNIHLSYDYYNEYSC